MGAKVVLCGLWISMLFVFGAGDTIDDQAPCPQTADPDDELNDRWPADFNDDQSVNILEIVQLTPPVSNSSPPDPNYAVRKDFNGDGVISILDIVRLTPPMFGQSCT